MRPPISTKSLDELDALRKKYPHFWKYEEAYLEDDVLSWFQTHGADYYTYTQGLLKLMKEMCKPFGECHFDHHGNCQEHFLGNPCPWREARFLTRNING